MQQYVTDKLIGTEARESFTQKVTAEMWSKNPSPGTYVAAICYNMGYNFANADHSEVTKVELKSGSLHTEYGIPSEMLVTRSRFTWPLTNQFTATTACSCRRVTPSSLKVTAGSSTTATTVMALAHTLTVSRFPELINTFLMFSPISISHNTLTILE